MLPVGIAAVHKGLLLSASIRQISGLLSTAAKTCVIGAALTKQWAKYTGRKAVWLLFQNGVNRIKALSIHGRTGPPSPLAVKRRARLPVSPSLPSSYVSSPLLWG